MVLKTLWGASKNDAANGHSGENLFHRAAEKHSGHGCCCIACAAWLASDSGSSQGI